MNIRSIFLLLGLLLVTRSPIVVCAQESRIWTDKSGKHEIRAKFIDIVEGKVRLERPNGDISRIPLEKLSKKDQTYVKEWKNPKKSKPQQQDGPRYLKVGDRVDARDFGKWYPGVVTEINYHVEHANVKLDNGDTAHFCSEDDLRWPGTRESPILKPAPDPALANLKVVDPDYSEMLRVTSEETKASQVLADPLPTPPESWRPKSVRLDAAPSVHIRIEDFSVACEVRPLAILLNVDPFQKHGPPKIELVDLSRRKKLAEGPAPPHTSRVVLSPSGSRIATLTTGKSGADSIGQLNTWELVGKQVTHTVAFSPYDGERWSKIDPEWIAWLDDQHLFTTNSEGRTYLWQADKGKAVYEVLTQRSSNLALSPGRKYLAVPTADGIDILDSRTGENLARVGSGNMRSAHLAFSPAGQQIAAVSPGFVDVVDITTGELTRSFPIEKISGHEGVTWVDETYLLVDNRALIHVPLRILAWELQMSTWSSAASGSIPWIVDSSGQHRARTVTPLILPPPELNDAVAALDESEMLVVRPGASLSIDSDIRDRALAQAVENALEQAVLDAGMQISKDASLVLKASVRDGKTEEINYRSFHDHFGKGETINVTQRVYNIQLLQDGVKIWQRESVHSPPMHLHMEKGENARAAISRVMQPRADNFRGRLPTYIVRPEFQGPLGKSRISGG